MSVACMHKDAMVIGLGFGGVSALVELNEYAKSNPGFSFMALEANGWIGGKAGSASALSGIAGTMDGFEDNPLHSVWKQYSDPDKVPLHRLTWRFHEVFDTDGEPKKPAQKFNARQNLNMPMECVTERANSGFYKDASTSIEQALIDCGYIVPPETTGSWENIYNDLLVGLEFVSRDDQTPVFAAWPVHTYDDYGPFDLFIQHKFNGAKIAEDYLFGAFGGGPAGQAAAAMHYKLNTEVTNIQWCPVTGGPAKVMTATGECYETYNIVSTMSAGVLHYRGDNTYGEQMFTPPLPPDQLQAHREIFIQDGRIDTDRYVEIFVQFDTPTWDSFVNGDGDPFDQTMLYIETGVGELGYCNSWQVMDPSKSAPKVDIEYQDFYWPDSHTFVCWLITEEVDKLTGCPQCTLAPETVRDLIKLTLAKVLGASDDLIDECEQIHVFPFLQNEVHHANDMDKSCVFGVEGDEFSKYFAGTYGGLAVRPWNQETYQKAIQTLPPEGPYAAQCPNTKLVIAGEHTCQRYWGFMHGALLSGRKAIKELLGWDGVQPYFCGDVPDVGAFDDPHFKTWGDKYYDFMGACDLHLVIAPHFAPDLPLVIDIRTKLRYDYSYIERAVVQIGNETLEVGSFGEHFLNGVDGGSVGPNREGLVGTLAGFPVNLTRTDEKVHKFEIQLGKGGETLVLRTVHDMVSVMLDHAEVRRFADSQGMMGEFGSGRLLARDGKTVLGDPTTLAAEWQVRQDEPMLFQSVDGPQHPQTCQMPGASFGKTKERRLRGAGPISHEAAENACAKWSSSTKEGCIRDVMATADLDLAAEGGL